ncbi:MAG: transposase [bacterium]|nr:transposase [bacterium]
MRKQTIVTNEYYHIYNRGVDKRDVFNNKEDLERFIESIKEFNQVEVVNSIRDLKKSRTGQPAPEALARKEPLVAFVGYCINPNHFHFMLKQLVDGGAAKFMQKLQAGYTSYFNLKNKRTGSLFQGAFKSHYISNDDYLRRLLGYVNKNHKVHTIPKEKYYLVFAGENEYKNNEFEIISKHEGEKILESFGGIYEFENHCEEIVSIIRRERGKLSLLEEDELPLPSASA